MTVPQLEIQAVAVVTAVACALSGVFLVLRRMAMMSDAISHSILVGIVLAYFATRDLTSPLLVLGAAATGLATVALVELLQRGGRVREDAAIGLVFPALFSAGVLLISRYAGDVHLDTDAVLLGELAFAPFDRFVVAGWDVGPRALWLMLGVLLLSGLFVAVFYKELKLATFDPGLATALGFSPALIHYGLMGVVSVTTVGAFDAVGLILVVALMVGPAAAAYLLTDRLAVMIGLSALLGASAAVAGYWTAHLLDVSIAGAMATLVGVEFGLVLLLARDRGLLAQARRRARQKLEFAQAMLAIHLYQHEGLPEAEVENRVDHLSDHLRWEPAFAARIVRLAEAHGYAGEREGRLELTEAGRELARRMLVR